MALDRFEVYNVQTAEVLADITLNLPGSGSTVDILAARNKVTSAVISAAIEAGAPILPGDIRMSAEGIVNVRGEN